MYGRGGGDMMCGRVSVDCGWVGSEVGVRWMLSKRLERMGRGAVGSEGLPPVAQSVRALVL